MLVLKKFLVISLVTVISVLFIIIPFNEERKGEINHEAPLTQLKVEPTPQTISLVDVILKYQPTLDITKALQYSHLIESYSDEFDIDPLWVTAMVRQESEFDEKAISNHGAIGLMQILPSTAKEFGVSKDQLYDPEINLYTGVRYLAYLQDYYGGDLRMATIAYNQGMGNVDRNTYKTWYYDGVYGHYQDILKIIKDVQ